MKSLRACFGGAARFGAALGIILALGGPAVVAAQPAAAIWTDATQYRVGAAMQVCYRIPIAGTISIIDRLANGNSPVFWSGDVSATEGCLPGTITPPNGRECLELHYPLLGGQGTVETCFEVVGPAPPITWVVLGQQRVAGGGWSLETQVAIPSDLTSIRVTSGSCDDTPAATLVWEGNFQRTTGGPLGVDRYTGPLNAVGSLTISNGGAGSGTLSRPVTLGAQTQVSLQIQRVGLQMDSTMLTACARQP